MSNGKTSSRRRRRKTSSARAMVVCAPELSRCPALVRQPSSQRWSSGSSDKSHVPCFRAFLRRYTLPSRSAPVRCTRTLGEARRTRPHAPNRNPATRRPAHNTPGAPRADHSDGRPSDEAGPGPDCTRIKSRGPGRRAGWSSASRASRSMRPLLAAALAARAAAFHGGSPPRGGGSPRRSPGGTTMARTSPRPPGGSRPRRGSIRRPGPTTSMTSTRATRPGPGPSSPWLLWVSWRRSTWTPIMSRLHQ